MINFLIDFCFGILVGGGIVYLMARKTIEEIRKDRDRLSEDYGKLIDQKLKQDLKQEQKTSKSKINR